MKVHTLRACQIKFLLYKDMDKWTGQQLSVFGQVSSTFPALVG